MDLPGGDLDPEWIDEIEEMEDRWMAFAEEDPDSTGGIEIEPVFDSRERKAVEIGVVEQEMPSGLFGFTRRGSSTVHVNRSLYRVDRERTIRHEIAHHRFPKDELTIRYINGDPEVRNTLSFRADNPSRIGGGSVGRSGNVAAYGYNSLSY